MINDLIPTGFSSLAAMKLLKTMDLSMANNSSFLAMTNSTAFDSTLKKGLSGDTMFSIIAAAASAKAASPAVTQEASSTASADGTAQGQAAADPASITSNPWIVQDEKSAPPDAAAGMALLAADPETQKSYTVAQGIDMFYGQTQELVDSINSTPGGNPTGASAGNVMAASIGLTGDVGTSFATAYDNRTLKFSDPNATITGLNYVNTHTVLYSDGIANGENGSVSLNESALRNYSNQHPNMLLGGSYAFGSWQGDLISW